MRKRKVKEVPAKKKKRKIGRPSKYETIDLLRVEELAKSGCVDIEIARSIGISESTFYNYAKEFPEFLQSLKRGREVADAVVERAMFKRACGFTYEEVTKEPPVLTLSLKKGKKPAQPITNDSLIVTKVVVKQVAPDTTAGIYWLKNRKPGSWQDKQKVEHTFKMTEDERKERVERLKRHHSKK